MKATIYPCITLQGKTSEAADFYIDTFGDGKITQTSRYVVMVELSGERIMLLNEGPQSKPNASISFMLTSETVEETERYWFKLVQEGKVFMPLDSYDWSSKYGWVKDKYGVSWQLYTGSRIDTPQKFSPTFMFTGTNAGKAAEAVDYYTHLYPEASLQGKMNYGEDDADRSDFIKHAQFTLKGFTAMAMDSSANHGFAFNDAISFVVECDSQEEIDKYWNELTNHGGMEIACGWLVDKYGISWQIIPKKLSELMTSPERAQRVMGALMKMKKLIVADLESA
jgi:predicted 3-demethylubiquinone-9 3-methyltransferase (glyoxalase superfamily)